MEIGGLCVWAEEAEAEAVIRPEVLIFTPGEVTEVLIVIAAVDGEAAGAVAFPEEVFIPAADIAVHIADRIMAVWDMVTGVVRQVCGLRY